MSSTPDDSIAYLAFLDCTKDFYRQAGRELPYFESDPQSPLTFEASVGEAKFSIGYDPAASEASLFIYCAFGPIPEDGAEIALRRLLALNIGQAREHNATYCIDTTTDEAVYYQRRDPAQVDAAWLREQLDRVALQAEQWRHDPFSDNLEEPGSSDDADTVAPWQAFA